MAEFILHFDEIEEAHRDGVGGKGYALARLGQAGFPVPPGFVVTTDAYRTFLAANKLDVPIADALADDGLAAASARIRAALEEAGMPPAVAAAIRDAYLVLGEGEVVVRSSALAEDSEVASFAGQYETILDVAGLDVLLVAVRSCWASLWSERALVYRRRLGFEGDAVAMAVVVQRMVSAAQAGVAFTLDPVSDRRDVIVVEAVAGGGEALVGGRATPHRYIVQRGNDYPQVLAEEGVLSGDRLAAVVYLAQEVESWAGQPQDVEWVLDEAGRVYLLQARPITIVSRNQVFQKEPGFYWTRDNVGEVIPGPVTPLSWSVLDPLGNRSFAGVLQRLGVDDYPDAGLFGRFYGRVYFNQTLFQAMMSRFYPSHAGWLAAPRLALTALRALLLLRRLPAESEEAIRAILEQRCSEKDLLPDTRHFSFLISHLSSWRRLGADAMEVHLTVSVMAELLYQALDKLLERWGDGTATAATLTSGLTGVRSAEAGQALVALARQVCRDESLRALVLTTTPEALPARLSEMEAGRALWAQIEVFLVEHGHSAAQEFELAAPRWRDDPAIILSALQTQVRVAAGGRPRLGGFEQRDGTAACLAATARIGGQLALPKRWLFRRLLRWTQDFVVTRENLKYHFVIAHSRLRDLYLALASRLVAAGRLTDADDIFFLTADEVTALVEEGFEAVSARVDERRRAWEADRRTAPPLALEQLADGRLRPVSPSSLPSPPDDGDDDGQSLCGFAASPGSYTGRARVVLTPDDGAGLEPGEVLVAPATSPGWAPLFLAAGALITEIGGTLSHGAIIAREYGLPAVLNVPGATRRIRTGQLVHVDGDRGTVQLLGEVA